MGGLSWIIFDECGVVVERTPDNRIAIYGNGVLTAEVAHRLATALADACVNIKSDRDG